MQSGLRFASAVGQTPSATSGWFQWPDPNNCSAHPAWCAVGRPAFNRLRGDPHGKAATRPKYRIILTQVSHPELHLGNMMAAIGVVFVGRAVYWPSVIRGDEPNRLTLAYSCNNALQWLNMPVRFLWDLDFSQFDRCGLLDPLTPANHTKPVVFQSDSSQIDFAQALARTNSFNSHRRKRRNIGTSDWRA